MSFYDTLKENRDIYEIMSKNVVEPERLQMKMWRSVACWINKATRAQRNTHTQEYVIRVAFPLQKWLREPALMLHYVH